MIFDRINNDPHFLDKVFLILLLNFIFFRFYNFILDVLIKIILSKNESVLYFHARKFSMPSILSSSLVLGAILSRRSLKIEISPNENLTLPGYVLD